MRLTTPDIHRTLLTLGAVIATFVAASAFLKDKNDGLLGVVSAISWFGLLVLVPAFVILTVVTASRRRRASR